jgi:hypothetical protein
MKLERKNLSPSFDADATLTQLERTMLASIALMKRLRRQHRRFGNVGARHGNENRIAPRQRSFLMQHWKTDEKV